jgi:Tfp pilus assembly protein PilN
VLALSGLFQLELFMTQTHSKSRQQAEIAFGHTQSQFFARNHAIEELESVVQAREAKTQRLREARLAKEAEDIAKASAVLIAKGTRKG